MDKITISEKGFKAMLAWATALLAIPTGIVFEQCFKHWGMSGAGWFIGIVFVGATFGWWKNGFQDKEVGTIVAFFLVGTLSTIAIGFGFVGVGVLVLMLMARTMIGKSLFPK